jgi:hypothetical protein
MLVFLSVFFGRPKVSVSLSAGAWAQALSRFEGPTGRFWARGFFKDLSCRKLGLPEEVTLGLQPLLNETVIRSDAWGVPPTSPFLSDIATDIQTRWEILLALLMSYISEGNYDSRTRTAFRNAAAVFGVSWKRLGRREDALFESIREGLLLSASDRERKASCAR